MIDVISFVFKLLVMFFDVQNIVAEVGQLDYVVDCSACQYKAFTGIDSYSCSVRCEVQGEYQMRYQYSIKLRTWKQHPYTLLPPTPPNPLPHLAHFSPLFTPPHPFPHPTLPAPLATYTQLHVHHPCIHFFVWFTILP